MGNHLFYYKRQTRDTKILSSLDCDSSNHNLPRFSFLSIVILAFTIFKERDTNIERVPLKKKKNMYTEKIWLLCVQTMLP